jgi:hypothetical protein
MKFVTSKFISVAVAAICGFVVLIGYFIQVPWLGTLGNIFLRFSVILASVALWIGLFSLARNHWERISGKQQGWFFSLVTLIAMLVTILIGMIYKPTSKQALWIFNFIHVPIESSLAAVLAIILVYTAARLLYRRLNFTSVVFLIIVLLVISGTVSLSQFEIPGLTIVRSWILQVWSLGGLRGLLLGVALGAIATGVRVLIGLERPYQGES